MIGLRHHTSRGMEYVKYASKVFTPSDLALIGYANRFDNSDVKIYNCDKDSY